MASIQQLMEKIQAGQIPKVVALAGSERALLMEALSLIREKVVDNSTADLNHQKFELQKTDFSECLCSLKSMPFLAPFRLVEVGSIEKLSAKELTELKSYIEQPIESSYLVLLFDKFDKRNSVVSALTKMGVLYESNPLGPSDVSAFIKKHALALSMNMSQQAISMLQEILDNDVCAITNALEKLSLAKTNSEPVLVEDILLHVANTASPDAFLLVRAIAEGQLKKSLVALTKLKEGGENPLKFLGLLQWQLRTIVSLRHFLDEGMSDVLAGKSAQIYGDRLFWMLKVAKHKNMAFHTNRLLRTLQADAALKSVNTHYPYSYVEKLVYQSAVGF